MSRHNSAALFTQVLIYLLIGTTIDASVSALLAQPGIDSATRVLTIRVVRDIGARSATPTPLADVAVDYLVKSRGHDSVVASARTAISGEAELRLTPARGGALRVRRIGYIAQRLAIPQSDASVEIRMREQPLQLGQICISVWGPGAVLHLRVPTRRVAFPVRVRIWTTRPRKSWADTTLSFASSADTTLHFDAPQGRPFNIAVRAAGYRPWSRYGVTARGNRSCGGAGVVFAVPLKRVGAVRTSRP